MTFRDLRQVNFSLGKSAFRKTKKELRKPYKHCRLLRLLGPLCEKVTKGIKKTIGFHSKLMTFRDLRQVNFSLGKSAIRKTEKGSCENLINTIVY